MADPALAANSRVVIDYEDTWGFPRIGGSIYGRQITVVSDSLLGTQELLDNPSIRSDFNPSAVVSGKKSSSGSIVLVPNVYVMPMLMDVLLHNIQSHAYNADYIHVSKLGSFATPKSLIIETKMVVDASGTPTDEFKTATGVRINRMSIPLNPDGFMQVTLDCAAEDVTVSVSEYDASPDADWTTETPFEMLQLASADVQLGGSSVGYIASGTLDISSNLFTDDYRLGSAGARGSLVPQRFSIGGSLKLALDAVGIITMIDAGTPVCLDLKWIAASGKYWRLVLPDCYLQKTQAPLQDGPLFLDVTFKAVYSTDVVQTPYYATFANLDATVELTATTGATGLAATYALTEQDGGTTYIPGGTTVSSVTDGDTIEMSAAATGTGSEAIYAAIPANSAIVSIISNDLDAATYYA